MYGGEIIGGTAAPQKNEKTGKYTYGLGGAVQNSGTMRMYGGVIRDGKAPAAYYYNKGKLTLSRGMGGNLFLSSGSVTEITGGKILNGFAGNVGGNIMMDGTAELIISGGEISGGRLHGRIAGKNGANVYCPSKGKITMTGGKITDGRAVNGGGGNIALAGTMTMSNATISGGYAGQRGGNILMSGKAFLRMEPGAVIMGGVSDGGTGGFGGGNIALISDDARLDMIGGAIRDGVAKGTAGADGDIAGDDGGNINMNRGTVILRGGVVTGGKASGNGDGIYVGWNSQMLRLEQNIQIYDNGDTDIVRSANTSTAKSQIILGSWKGNSAKRSAPVVERLEATGGKVVVTSEDGRILTAADAEKFAYVNPVLPLEADDKGNIILGTAYLGEPDHNHCLCAGNVSGHTCTDTGFVSVNAEVFEYCWAQGSTRKLLGSMNICLTEDVTISSEHAVSGNELNLCLHGHTITMTDDARITANGTTGVLNITDCTGKGKILAAENCRASFLFIYKGVLNLYGGTVDGSKLGDGLGAVRVGYDGDIFNLYGGTVIGSKNAKSGGATYCVVAGTTNIMGGTVRDGVSYTTGGGNIFLNHSDAVLNISGGTISGGKATNTAVGSGLGGNIHVVKGKLNITGGTITGGVAKGKTGEAEIAGATGGVYAAYNAGTFKLSGKAKIYGNTGSDIWLTSKSSYVVTLGDWDGNGSKGALVIGKTGATVGTQLVTGVEKSDMEKFASAHEQYVLKRSGGKLILATPYVHDHCLCGGKLEHTCTTTSFVEVASQEEFDALFDSKAMLTESVSIVLNAPIELKKEYKLNGYTMDLCLNGQTMTFSGSGRLTANGTTGVLNITDCASGKIVAASGAAQSFLYTYKGKINLYGGTVDASAIQQSIEASGGKSGGIFTVYEAGDVVTMYGGKLIGATLYRGASVYAYKGTFVMLGGEITGGYARVGGAVATDFGTFTMGGGKIYGNKAGTNGAGVFLGFNSNTALTLSGDAAIYGNDGPEDVYCGQKVSYNVNHLIVDGWNGNGTTPMRVDRRDAAVGSIIAAAKTGALDAAVLKSLAYPNEELRLLLSEGKVVLGSYHRHCVCAGKVDGHSCTDVKFVDVATEAEFSALFEMNVQGRYELKESVNVVLTDSFTLKDEYVTNGHVLTLCLNDKTLTLDLVARLTANGGAGELNITACGDGKIVTAENGLNASVYVQDATFNLYAGTLDATAIDYEMVSGAGNGGAVYVNTANACFNMYGGTVKGGQLYRGGAVYVYLGTFNMYDGTVTDGRAAIGGNVAVNQGYFNMYGGTITDGYAKTNGAGVHMGYGSKDSMVISGKAAIYGNEGPEDLYLGLSSANKNVLVLDGWTGNGANDPMVLGSRNAAIGAVMVTAKTGALDSTMLSQFAYPGDVLQLALSDGKYVLEEILYHKHCLCNGKYTGTGHTCQDVTFQEITGTDAFLALFDESRYLKKSVSVYLTGDVELSTEYWTNGNTLSICLNGHTITMKDTGRLTSNKTTGILNITDCGKGKIQAAEGAQHGFLYGYNGDINLYGGTVNAKNISKSLSGSEFGAAVFVSQTGDTFTMYGGLIEGGTVARGGAAFAQNGSVVIRSGKITGGHAKVGGGVGVNFGTFEMTGGEITGNSATTNGAGVFLGYNMTSKCNLGGNAAIYGNTGCEDLRLGQKNATDNVIILDGWTGCGEGNAMSVSSVSEKDGAVVAEGKTDKVTEAQLAFLTSYNDDYTLVLNADGKVALKKLHKHCICNGDAKNEEGHTCSTLTYTEVATLEQFQSYFTVSGDKYLLNASCDLVLTGSFTLDKEYVMNGNTMNLCLNGQTITMSSKGRLTANGTSGVLNINACGDGKIVAASDTRIGMLYTYKGVMNIFGGTVDATNTAAGEGGAIVVGYAGDVVNIYGGTIKGSQKGTNGGAIICKAKATINIYDGTISGGKASTNGGNICMNAGDLTISGGSVEGGTATCSGGNICVLSGSLTVTGGTVSDGEATGTANSAYSGVKQGGGNIYLYDGTLTVDGGKITKGESKTAGGNFLLGGGKTYVKGGEVSDGVATHGGNICVYGTAQLFVSDGTISGGESNGNGSGYGGGNIYCGDGAATTGSITISGGTISGGKCKLDGGNININRGSLTVTGGTITTGDAEGNGGGIYVGWNGTGVTISGSAKIYGNETTDIVRCANTSTTKGTLLLGDWAGNGENGAAKLDTLFTAAGKTVISAASGYTITEADIAKFACVGTYGLKLSSGKLVTAAK